MGSKVKIGIIGDFDGRPSHIATQDALMHSAQQLELDITFAWLPTQTFETDLHALPGFDGLWGAPGSPYKSMNGAICAIHFAREKQYPYLGTCGGFQHAIIEYGRNVLHIDALTDKEFDLYAPNSYISELSCSLVGKSKRIFIDKNSRLFEIYGCTDIEERYNCSFGVNRSFQNQLDADGFKIIGVDEDGEARVMSVDSHPFFFVTLFQPQLSSTYEKPHPLINAYLAAVTKLKASR